MKIIKSPQEMQKFCLQIRQKKTIGLVPTMGGLHEGHLRLIREAKKRCSFVVVSIFVNPAQFGPKEDFKKYPHDLKGDFKKLKSVNVDCVFSPTVKTMYPEGFQTFVEVTKISQDLCGGKRPGHFRGVVTVVLKLFQIVRPHFAFFGEKDYQQFRIIQVMAKDLALPIKIVGVQTVREKDGLAMSSRNSYLTFDQRLWAKTLWQGLNAVKMLSRKKTLSAKEAKKIFCSFLPKQKTVRLDYFEVVHKKTLQPLQKIKKAKTLIAVAIFIGRTRLIDNLLI